jgi:hypothetical protein
VLFAASESVRARVDLMIQPYLINMYTVDLAGSTTVSVDASGVRYFLMAGIEF